MKISAWALKSNGVFSKGVLKPGKPSEFYRPQMPELFRTKAEAVTWIKGTGQFARYIPVKVTIEIKESYK